MEPKLPAPNRGPEQLPPAFSQGVEHSLSIPAPEKVSEGKPERVEARPEDTAPNVPFQPVLPPPLQPSSSTSDDDANSIPADDTPLVAADDDLIEKEWVDKAKAIVIKTKDDPYQREQEVSKLQVEYLRKRYGKELGAS